MRIPPVPHSWAVGPREAVAIQLRLRSRVRVGRPTRPIRYVAGLDSAFSEDGTRSIAAAVLWDRRLRVVVEQRVAVRRVRFPYVPGLLSFREAPALLAALSKLRHRADALMCDGHGLAHPRRFGIACHIGVLCNLPAIGCAKSLLVGETGELAMARGSRSPLSDEGEVVGTALRTREGVKPVYVSVGHAIDLPTAERVVLDCATRFRLPEPTRLADRLVAQAKPA